MKIKEVKICMSSTCVMCGGYAGEGSMVCWSCQKKFGGKCTKVIYRKGVK